MSRLAGAGVALVVALVASAAGAAPKAKTAADTSPPIITHVRVTKAPLGKPILLRAKIDDESEIFAPSVYVRVAGTTDFDTVPLKHAEDGWEATLPARTSPVVLEYFLEAFDDQLNGPAREGSPEAPIRLVVGDPPASVVAGLPTVEPNDAALPLDAAPAEPSDEGIAGRWWFWTIVGVGVTGAVVAAAIALQSQGGRVDSVDITVRGPDPTRGL